MKKNFKLSLALIATALCSTALPSTQAALIAYEGYSSTSPSFGFSTTNLQTAGSSAIGLSYPGLLTSGDARTFGGYTNPVTGFSDGAISGTFYISFLLDASALDGRTGLTLFTGSNGDGKEVAEFGNYGGYVSIFNGSFNEEPPTHYQPISSGIATSEGTHLYVIGYDQSTTTLSLWYDPTPGEAAPTAVATLNVGTDFSLGSIRLFETDSATFDEIRIGTTFADVTPVPEPGTMALMGVSGMSLLLFRRRAVRA